MSFIDTIEHARSFLERNGKLSLRVLKREFGLTDDALDDLVEQLVDVERLAAREGAALVWLGPPASATHPHDVGTAATSPSRPLLPTVAEAERRQLTVMFCDLVDSTNLSQQLDAEDLRTIVRAYQRAAEEAILRHEGHVVQYLGDGLLVYFGYPMAHDEDADRAVRAGLEILTGLTTLNEAVEPTYGIRLAARVGIHTGPVVIGEMGGGAHSEVLALGDTTNIAARIEGAADRDSVMISDATHRLIVGRFVTEDRGPQQLKGIREPMTLYRVVQPSPAWSRLAIVAGRLTHFVGRDTEMAALADRWQRVLDGEGQTVVVLGEAGVGKSRLVYELRSRLAGVPHTWLECAAMPYTQATPFHPIAELARQALGFAKDESPADASSRIEAGLGRLASVDNVYLLADFLGLPTMPAVQMSPDLQRRRTIELLVQWILSLSASQPLLVLVDDLQWCDSSTLELLKHLITQTPTARVLLLVTARADFKFPWPARHNLPTLQLTRLTDRQARDMIATLSGGQLPAPTLDALVARADGVPLYVEELTKSMTDPGAARGADAIPASLADSLMGRLDRLSAAKEVAQRAAVIGREFSYPLLAAMAGMDEAGLRHGLDRLVNAEILFARGEPPNATYTFKHALIQETAYHSLLNRTRQHLHEGVARALEEQFPEHIAAQPEVVARHYEQAGLVAQAIGHFRRAGEQATRRSANEESISHLQHSLMLVEKLPASRDRLRQELAIQMAIAVPLIAARGWSHPEHAQAFSRARELATLIGDSPELPRVLAGMANACQVKGEITTATALAEQALASAGRTGNAFDLVSAHYQVGLPLFLRGRFCDALRQFEEGMRLYAPAAHAELAYEVGYDCGVGIGTHTALCHAYRGHLDRALASSGEAVALARQIQHPLSLAHAIFYSGRVAFERGELSVEPAEELIALSERVGLPFYSALGRVQRCLAELDSVDPAKALADVERTMTELAQFGTVAGAPEGLFWLACILRKADRREEAQDAITAGIAIADEQEQHSYYAELHRMRAELLIDVAGDAGGEAEASYGQALKIAGLQEARTFGLRAATGLARLWQRQGKRDEATGLLAPHCAWFTEGLATRDVQNAKALMAELAFPDT